MQSPRRSVSQRTIRALKTAVAAGFLGSLLAVPAVLTAAAPAPAPGPGDGAAPPTANRLAVKAMAVGKAPAPPPVGRAPRQGPLEVNTAVAEAVRPGGRLAYTIHYTNTGASPVANAVLADTLSAGQSHDGSFVANPTLPPDAFTRDGLQMQWALGTLAAGAAGTISLETTVDDRPEPTAQQPVRLVGNVARLTGDGVPTSEDEAVARVVGPILELSLDDGPDPVLPGRTLLYTATLRNLDRSDAVAATGIVISTVVPAEVEFASATSGGTFDAAKGHVVWHLPGPLEPGQALAVTYGAVVSPTILAPVVISVNRDHYVARSAEIKVNDITGRTRISTQVDPLLQKEAEGPRTVVRGAVAFPGDVVTYTLLVNNPLSSAMTGVQVTDTLPGNPAPFEFRAAVAGAAPQVDGANLRWPGVDLPPGGRAIFKYTVRVPANTFITDNSTMGTLYGSDVTAHHTGFAFQPSSNTGQVRIYPPVTMDKVVKPNTVQTGEEVAYTITLQNRATFPIGSIRLTDTMRGELFRFTGMLKGPAPETGHDTNPVVWTNIEVPAGGTTVLAFSAVANGFPLVSYANDLHATTPATYIPARTNRAQVKIASPFGIDKTVTPDQTYLDSTVRYDLSLANVTTMTWALARVTDTLPTGMFDKATGRRAAVIVNDPPAQVRPGEGWDSSFEAYVGGDIECRLLPRNLPNSRGRVQLHFTSPIEAVFANAADMAPLRLMPNVTVYITPTRAAVLPGDAFVYNLRLQNTSTAPGTNAGFTMKVPEGFSYRSTLQGPAPDVAGRELRWSSLQLPPASDQTIVIAMQAGQDLGRFSSDFSGTAEGIFCIQRLTNKGSVEVREDVVELTTRSFSNLVPPGGPVDLELRVRNYDPEPYALTAITDTLPTGFSFVSMVTGNEPDAVDDNQVVWRGVTVPGSAQMAWRFRARASTLFGAYQNRLAAFSPETRIRPAVSEAFQVVPMVQLAKEASVATVAPGSTLVYTVTLLNLSPAVYSNITVTDTLPAGFTYERMILGNAPAELGPGRSRPVWQGLSIGANGGVRTFAFAARVEPSVGEGTVFNQVDGSSPNVVIPGSDHTAPVLVSRSVPTTTPPPGTAPPRPSATPPGPSPTATRPSATTSPGPTNPGPTPTKVPPTPSPGLPYRLFLPFGQP